MLHLPSEYFSSERFLLFSFFSPQRTHFKRAPQSMCSEGSYFQRLTLWFAKTSQHSRHCAHGEVPNRVRNDLPAILSGFRIYTQWLLLKPSFSLNNCAFLLSFPPSIYIWRVIPSPLRFYFSRLKLSSSKLLIKRPVNPSTITLITLPQPVAV